MTGVYKNIYESHTSDHNLNASALRWSNGKKDDCFRWCITLDDNPRWEFKTYTVGMMVFEYSIGWMSKNGYKNIAEYLNGRRADVDVEFTKAAELMVGEKLKEIDDIKRRLLPPHAKGSK